MRNGLKDQQRMGGRSTWIAGSIVCAATALLVFVFPFAVPSPFVPTISASYVAGFNNRAAAVAAALIGISVLFWSWRRSRPTDSPFLSDREPERLGPLSIRIVVLATCAFFAIAEWLVAQSHLRYIADVGYFIEQMTSHAEYGRTLYTELEFAYGPLLFYPTIFLQRLLHCSWLTAYFVTLAIDQSVGLVLLAYVLNELPFAGRDRRIGFVLFAIGALNPLLGLNYTFLRLITPFATLLLATRSDSLWRTTVLLAAGELLQLGISPELGFAFLAGAMTFVVLRAFRDGLRWLIAAVAPALGLLIFLLTFGRPYLRMLASFSRGALNLPVAPYPHILIFLIALVWLVPLSLGKALRSNQPKSLRMAACYALAIGLLPAAFGRCDPLHVFFNGIGVFVLSLACIRTQPARVRTVWLGCLVIFVAWLHYVNGSLYLDRTADTLRIALIPRLPERLRASVLAAVDRKDPDLADHLRPNATDAEYRIDVSALEHEVGYALVATPLEISPTVEDALKRSHHYRSDFYSFFVDVMNPASEAKKIRDLNEAEWALLPAEPEDPFLETPQNIDGVQGFAFPYPQRNPIPYDLGSAFSDNLERQWIQVRKFGPYILYRRLHDPIH